MRKACFFFILSCFLMAAGAPRKNIEILWAVKIPMRDGIRLHATVYKPADKPGRLPVIFTLTPYMADSYHSRAVYFAQNDFVFALVDMRGRGNSEGHFNPSPRNDHENEDTYDLVEWFARQPWSDGQVAMWGGSYSGYNQWIAAKQFPPHLKTIVPAACSHPCIDLTAVNNIFPSSEARWTALVNGRTSNDNLYSDSDFWISKFQERYRKHLPFHQLDRIAGIPSRAFQEEIAHPACDDYWLKWALSENDYKRINLPVLSIAGQFDDQQRGQIYGYLRHMKFGRPEAAARHYLLIGPWDHAGTRTPQKHVGGLVFSDKSLVDLNDLHRDWYNWVMRRGKKPDFLKERITYYVSGAEEWRYAKSFDALSKRKLSYYLQPGRLQVEKPSGSVSRYRYDPLNIRPGDFEWQENKNYLVDQTATDNLGDAGVLFHSDPLQEDLVLGGVARLVAFISMNVPDTDFLASLYEISPDGKSVLLCEDRMRARYREGLSRAKLAKPGEINRYQFTTFNFFARKIRAGHKLRLMFRSPNSILWEKNYNSGGVVAKETAKDARVAEIQLHHQKNHASYLEIPVLD